MLNLSITRTHEDFNVQTGALCVMQHKDEDVTY